MIIYAAIARARDAATLVEVTSSNHMRGNFGQVTVTLLEHLRDTPALIMDGELKTFVQRNEAETDFFSHFIEACSVAFDSTNSLNSSGEEHYFHVFRKADVFYCCLGDDPDPRDQKVYVEAMQCLLAFLRPLRRSFPYFVF